MGVINSEKRAFFKKGYVIIFILSVSFLIASFIVITIASIIPSVDFGDPGYENYIIIITNLDTISTLFMNLGLGLFLLANFVGAMTENRLSGEVKRGMLIASLLGLTALILFNYLMIYFRIN